MASSLIPLRRLVSSAASSRKPRSRSHSLRPAFGTRRLAIEPLEDRSLLSIVLNGSFEAPAITPNGYSYQAPDSWNNSGYGDYIVNGSSVTSWFGSPAPDGSQVVDIRSSPGLWQNTGIVLQHGDSYQVTWMGSAETTATETVTLGFADDTSSLGTSFVSQSFDTENGVWRLCAMSGAYTGESGEYLTISLGAAAGGGDWGGGFDAVTITSQFRNGSFEAPAITPNGYSQTVPTCWNISSPGCDYIVNGSMVSSWLGAPALEGSQVVEVGDQKVLWQNTGIVLNYGDAYDVTWVGSAETTATETAILGFANDTSSQGTAFASGSFATEYGEWTPCRVSGIYTGVSGKYLTVSLSAAVDGGFWGGGFDAVSLSRTSPMIAIPILSPTSVTGDASVEAHPGYLTGSGAANYQFTVENYLAGWYALWANDAGWQTSYLLDGTLELRGQMQASYDPATGSNKVTNVYLTSGVHTLTISRPEPFGLPWVSQCYFDPAAFGSFSELTDSTHIEWPSDCAVFALDDPLTITVNTGNYDTTAHGLTVQVINDTTQAVVYSTTTSVPAETEFCSFNVTLPTSADGVFHVVTTDAGTGHEAEHQIQYVVVDTNGALPAPESLVTTLFGTIDPTTTAPDYSSGNSVVTSGPLGNYRESGDTGVIESANHQGDYIAYELGGLTVGQPYMLQVDYPDDAARTFTISVVQLVAAAWETTYYHPIAAGVACGGPYDLSNQIQTQEIVFWAAMSNPRVLILNFHSRQQAAVSALRLYTINTTSGYSTFPSLNGDARLNRTNSIYLEEPDRIPALTGNNTGVSDWNAQLNAVDRMAQWSRYAGINQWVESVATYGLDMWPSSLLYGYSPADEMWGPFGSSAYLGNGSPMDIFQKDLIRLELLKAEEYGIDYIPEINLVPASNQLLCKQLDLLWGGDGLLDNDLYNKPWITVDKDGNAGSINGSCSAYYNIFDPHVQAWFTSVVSELANRYADSPALKGVAIRLMAWGFNGNAFASLDWGYEDSTINAFRAGNPGLNMPDYTNANRFADRYNWLMANAKQTWIDWRCEQVTAFYQNLASVIREASPNLNLFIDINGVNYSPNVTDQEYYNRYDSEGWAAMLKDSGVDVATLRRDSRIRLMELTSQYPAGVLYPYETSSTYDYYAAAEYDMTIDPTPIVQSSASIATSQLLNGSFESPTITPNSYLYQAPDSWNNSGYGDYIANGSSVTSWFGAPAPDGSQVVDIRNALGLWQNTGIVLQHGDSYQVTWMGSAETTDATTETVTLGFANDTSSLGTSFASESYSVEHGVWNLYTVSGIYTGESGKYLTITLGVVVDGGGWGGGFDAVCLNGTVSTAKFNNKYMESLPFDQNQGGELGWSSAHAINLCGAINPAGQNYLARHAAAMAAGNVTMLVDGSLGYVIGQPAYLRPFMTEYMSLPDIGMWKLNSTGDAVLWYGSQEGKLDFYMVNPTDYVLNVTVTFSGSPSIYRLSSGDSVSTIDGTMTLTLQPYELLAFENQASTAAPTGFSSTPQSSLVTALSGRQLEFVATAIATEGGSSAPGYAQYVAAQTAYAAGKYWETKQDLMDHRLVELYQAYGAYPPPANLMLSGWPTNQAVDVGQTATFVVPNPAVSASYQWQKYNTGTGAWDSISGATGAYYTTAATAQSDDGALYRVMISNGGVQTIGPAATLYVNYGSEIWWKLDESGATTTAADSDGSTNNWPGTLVNFPTTKWAASIVNNAAVFDGIDSYIRTATSTAGLKYTGAELTLGTWVYVNTTETNGAGLISKPWNGVNDAYNYQLGFNAGTSSKTGTIFFSLQGSSPSGAYSIASSSGISTAAWHYIAATVDSSSAMKLYIDGVLMATGAHNITVWTPTDGNKALVIGSKWTYTAGSHGSTTLDGKMDNVQVYTHALSAEAIAAKAQAPIGFWQFNETSNTSAFDSSGNGYTGTLTASPSAQWATGYFNNAVLFNGTTGHVTAGASAAALKYKGGAMTLSTWVYVNATETTGGDLISKPWSTSGGAYNYQLGLTSANAVFFSLQGSAPTGAVTVTTAAGVVPASGWHHVAATVNNSLASMVVYVDGVQVSTTSSGTFPTAWSPTDTNQPLVIGSKYSTSTSAADSFDGKLDNVRVCDTALSAAAVQILAIDPPLPPTVQSVVVNDGSDQRSTVTSVTVTFSGVVTIDSGAFEVLKTGAGGGLVNVVMAYLVQNSVTVATLTFSGGLTDFGSLKDGEYQLTIRGDKVRSSDTQAELDGNRDGQAGGNQVFGTHAADKFFRLFGDSEGDGDIDNLDFARFRTTMSKTIGQTGFLSYFDRDRDGDVDNLDFAHFRLQVGKHI